MPPRLAFSAALLPLVVACASTVEPAPTPADASLADAPLADAASPDGASPDGTPADASACPPRRELPGAPACAGLVELTAAANAVAGSPDTYALTNLSPDRNTVRPECAMEPWQDGFESRVRFTAPRGGRWRFTASGEELWALDVRLHCGAPTACVGRPEVHGPFASATHTVDVQLERGESVSVALDGCPRAGACRYALRAQRVADLACEFATPNQRRCTAAAERCAVDACDPERFRCVAAPLPRGSIAGARVLVDDENAWVLARLDAPELARQSMMVRWLDAAGRELAGGNYLGSLRADGDDFVVASSPPPAGTVRAVLWLYDGAPNERHPGVEAPLERLVAPAAGAACDDRAFATRCGSGLRCEPLGAVGTCRPVTAVELTRVRAWRDDEAGALRVEIEGTGLGRHVQEFAVRLLGADGAALATLPTVVTATRFALHSDVSFRAQFELSAASRPPGAPAGFMLPRGVARVELVARDQDGARSAPAVADVAPVAVVAAGAFCDAPELGCGAGLDCADAPGGDRARCLPRTPPRACDVEAGAATWAPTGRGTTHALEGAPHEVGGITACYSGRSQGRVVLEFVAPAAGEYAFAQEGLRAIEVLTACGDGALPGACALSPQGSTSSSVTATLAAGQRTRLTLLGDDRTFMRQPFRVTVRVP
ncbi:MAG: hypothetical protein U0324_19080 [Polyangiales bacterium]